MRRASTPVIRLADRGRARPRLGQFIRFAGVGGCGFLVDGAVLWFLVDVCGSGPLLARAGSIPAAMVVTWILNRTFTFRAGRRPTWREFAGYAGIKSIGLAINAGVYTALIVYGGLAAAPLIALVLATAAAMLVNFANLRRFLYPG